MNNVLGPKTRIIRAASQGFHADLLKDDDAFAFIIREVASDTIFVIVTRSRAADEGFTFERLARKVSQRRPWP